MRPSTALVVSIVGLTGCFGEVSTGLIAPVGPNAAMPNPGQNTAAAQMPGTAPTPTGIEFHYLASMPLEGMLPNAYGAMLRQVGDEHTEQAMQVGWNAPIPLGHDGPMLFARLMFDLIGWQNRDDGDRNLTAFSPTLTIGFAPTNLGICISGQTTWEIRRGEPDRQLVGVFLGYCGRPKD
jgi:hypothetical protein